MTSRSRPAIPNSSSPNRSSAPRSRSGNARVSTGGQKLERQIDALTAAGCRKIFSDKKSGKTDLRPELKACHAFLDAGDTLVVPSLDRYGRSLQDLINIVAELRERGIGFTSLHESLDTTTPGGRLVFHVFAALAEFIRELIVQGTREGLAAARARGRVGDARQSPPKKSSGPPAICCPTPAAPSPRSRSRWASLRAPSTTTSPICVNCVPVPSRTSSMPRSGDPCRSERPHPGPGPSYRTRIRRAADVRAVGERGKIKCLEAARTGAVSGWSAWAVVTNGGYSTCGG